MSNIIAREFHKKYFLLKIKNKKVEKLHRVECIYYDERSNIREKAHYVWMTTNPEGNKYFYCKKPKIYRYVHKYENDKLVEILHYGLTNDLEGKELYTYDHVGRLSNKKLFSIDPDKIVLVMENTMRYDEGGRLIEEVSFFPDQPIFFKYNYEYDADGREIKHVMTSRDEGEVDDTIQERSMNYYDRNGRLIQNETVQAEYNFDRKKYEYDDQEKLLKEVLYNKKLSNSDFKLQRSIEYKYDDQGRLMRKTEYGMKKGRPEFFQTERYEYRKIKNGGREIINQSGFYYYHNGRKKRRLTTIIKINDRIYVK
jgi:hypothetical protein